MTEGLLKAGMAPRNPGGTTSSERPLPALQRRSRRWGSRACAPCAATSSIRPSPCITAGSSKRNGDGAIVEFRSVVDAVNCAIEIQRAMVERNVKVAPDRRIEFRVGIHLADVVEESDGDLMAQRFDSFLAERAPVDLSRLKRGYSLQTP